MCRGNLQYFGDCGHEKTFHPTDLCPLYDPAQAKCLGTLTICHQTVIHSPAICTACATLIETSMRRRRDRALSAFAAEIATLDRALGREKKDIRLRRAMESERASVRKAMVGFREKGDKELVEFREELGKDAPGRAEDLRHDWWDDEEEVGEGGSGQVPRARQRDAGRLGAPFDDDGWDDDDELV
ncbi:MAG: hypothetical protein Q9161_008476 [Pseudevernia consocians]